MELSILVILLFSCMSILVAFISLAISVTCYIKIKVFTESTHTVPLAPVGSSMQELLEGLRYPEDNLRPSSKVGAPIPTREEDGPFLKPNPEDLV